MKDVIGNELCLEDYVVCTDIRYKRLIIGKIIKITEKKVLIKYIDTCGLEYRKTEGYKDMWQVCKINYYEK